MTFFALEVESRTAMKNPLAQLPTFDPETGHAFAVIETPKGSRNKYAFNHDLGLFELRKVLQRA